MASRPEIESAGAPAERGSGALSYVPRLVVGALEDLRSIAASVRVLPDVVAHLAAIQAKTNSMEAEVAKMRAGVDELNGKVDVLNESVDRLEPHLEDVSGSLRPIRRAGMRLRRNRLPQDPGA